MGWFSKKSNDNELGEYLSDSDAQQYEQSEPMQASNKMEAEEKCKETAAEYGGTDPKAEQINEDLYNCKFKLRG